MSGALIQLVSKGVQDVYLTSDEGHSFFRSKFSRHTNFSQAPKFIKTISDKDFNITIPVLGDLINGLWLEGNNVSSNLMYESTVDLFIGGQKIDSQPYEYFSEIWPNYMGDTWTKAEELTNKTSVSNKDFLPLHFFFCDHGGFLPLIALAHHQVEIRINFKQSSVEEFTESNRQIKVYGNYIYLDQEERESLVKRQLDLVITQLQTIESPLETVADNETNRIGGNNDLDISSFNHPVKSIFFGFNAAHTDPTNDRFTFKSADIYINGTPLIENMSAMYFHTVQNYYKSKYGVSDFQTSTQDLMYTRFFCYHFCLNASEYNPSGTCNFSRLDNAKIRIRGAEKGSLRPSDQHIRIHALNYNVFRIKDGLGGILFGN